MLHGAGIFTNICPKTHPNLGKYTSAMVRIWDWAAMGNLDSIADVAVEIYSTTAWAHRKTHHELSGYEWTIPAFFWLLSPITVCKLYQLYEDTYNIL